MCEVDSTVLAVELGHRSRIIDMIIGEEHRYGKGHLQPPNWLTGRTGYRPSVLLLAVDLQKEKSWLLG